MFKQMLAKCIEGKRLSEHEAKQVMDEIMENRATPSQIASLLSIMRFRGETVDEMVGFAKSMKEHAITIQHNEKQVLDTCGTGGDGAGTFNISTASAIILSSLGVKVAKHGNRAVSSKSGSADVLEALNIPVQVSPDEAAKALAEKGMTFLFAPVYHAAMKYAAIPRKEIGFRTIFNVLGPLTNPANAKAQLLGVFDHEIAKKMAETLARIGGERALFVTGGEGLDEISITTYTNVVELKDGKISEYQITPEQFGLKRGKLEDLQVNSVEESAELIKALFEGCANESATNIVILNAAAGLYVVGASSSIEEAIHVVKDALQTGKVYQQFLHLQGREEDAEQNHFYQAK